MTTLEEKDIEKSKFIINCHELYDRIHGSKIVINIFDPISEKQLNDLIKIYNTSAVFLRRNMLTNYVKSKTNLNIRLVHFYENALQHYLYDN
tara:strand:+ start:1015 stop:1290 length:276 start_codon:yes stop_codon:yes gene_type:complete